MMFNLKKTKQTNYKMWVCCLNNCCMKRWSQKAAERMLVLGECLLCMAVMMIRSAARAEADFSAQCGPQWAECSSTHTPRPSSPPPRTHSEHTCSSLLTYTHITTVAGIDMGVEVETISPGDGKSLYNNNPKDIYLHFLSEQTASP